MKVYAILCSLCFRLVRLSIIHKVKKTTSHSNLLLQVVSIGFCPTKPDSINIPEILFLNLQVEIHQNTTMAFLHLQEWAEVAACCFNKVNSGLSLSQKRVLWDTVLSLNSSYGNIAQCPEVSDKWKVACSLAFVLRTRSIEEEWIYFPFRPSKPVLVVLTTSTDLSSLEEKFSQLVTDGNYVFFEKNDDRVSECSYIHLPYFQTWTIQGPVEAVQLPINSSSCDVVFSPWICLPYLQASDFSSVVVYGDNFLPPLELRKIYAIFSPDVSIVLFLPSPYHNTDIIEEINSALCQEPLTSAPSSLSCELLHETICQTDCRPAGRDVPSEGTKKGSFKFFKLKSSHLHIDENRKLHKNPFYSSRKGTKRWKKKKTSELELSSSLISAESDEEELIMGDDNRQLSDEVLKGREAGKEKKKSKARAALGGFQRLL